MKSGVWLENITMMYFTHPMSFFGMKTSGLEFDTY